MQALLLLSNYLVHFLLRKNYAILIISVKADLLNYYAMLNKLFESSQHLDNVAFHHLKDAL